MFAFLPDSNNLDTGYNATETKEVLKRMHKTKSIDWNTQKIDFCLLVYEKQNNTKQSLHL